MTRLSVNINKIATLRNARGGDLPDLIQVAKDCEKFGAQGITVHPRPDERHIKYADVPLLKEVVKTEYNIEGNPSENFIKLVESVMPEQVTLVPDAPGVLTSDTGWDTIKNNRKLVDLVQRFHSNGIRVSLFIDPIPKFIKAAKETGADRIEFYTGDYAKNFHKNKESAIKPFVETAKIASDIGIGINAGHDLNLDNLSYFKNNIPNLLEVSIGHALISDALYFGLYTTIQLYLKELER